MSTRTWLALILVGFLLSPLIGMSLAGLYLFNYATAIIFELWSRHYKTGVK